MAVKINGWSLIIYTQSHTSLAFEPGVDLEDQTAATARDSSQNRRHEISAGKLDSISGDALGPVVAVEYLLSLTSRRFSRERRGILRVIDRYETISRSSDPDPSAIWIADWIGLVPPLVSPAEIAARAVKPSEIAFLDDGNRQSGSGSHNRDGGLVLAKSFAVAGMPATRTQR